MNLYITIKLEKEAVNEIITKVKEGDAMKKKLRGIKAVAVMAALALAIVPAGNMNVVHAGGTGIEENENDAANVVITNSKSEIVFKAGSPVVVTEYGDDAGYAMDTNSVYSFGDVTWYDVTSGTAKQYYKGDSLKQGTLKLYLRVKAENYAFPSTLNVTFCGNKSVWNRANSIDKSIKEYGGKCQYVLTVNVPGADAVDINDASYFSFPEGESFVFNNAAVKLPVKITIAGKTLVEGTDYTVEYSNNTSAGWATAKFTGMGNYYGTFTKEFKIEAPASINIDDATVSAIPDQTYTGNAIEPAFTVTYDGKTLTRGNDFTVEYKYNTEASEFAAVILTGKGKFTGTKIVNFKIVNPAVQNPTEQQNPTNPQNPTTPSRIDINTVGISKIGDMPYTGKAIAPEITVCTGDGKLLKKDVDYTVSYSNNTKPGSAKVTVTGIGKYTGTYNFYFKIYAPKKGYTFSAGYFKYKITKSAGQDKEVAVIGPGTLTKSVGSKITIPATVKTLAGTYKVTSVANNAFKGYTKTTTIVIGKNVKSIGSNAFNGCKSLKKVTIQSTGLTKIGSKAFSGTNANISFKVPKKSLAKYTKMIKKSGASKKAKITK